MLSKVCTALVFPPLGACRFGCGTNCSAPISVFWLAGVTGVIYGLLGGPTGASSVDWYTVALGFGMWGIASVWTVLTISGVDADQCNGIFSPIKNKVTADADEADPFEEVRKAR